MFFYMEFIRVITFLHGMYIDMLFYMAFNIYLHFHLRISWRKLRRLANMYKEKSVMTSNTKIKILFCLTLICILLYYLFTFLSPFLLDDWQSLSIRKCNPLNIYPSLFILLLVRSQLLFLQSIMPFFIILWIEVYLM